MADVSGKFFSAKKVRTGVSPSSPGVEQGEVLPPVNPPGTSLNSVGLTMPSAFEVANSPLTSNGTIAVTGAGTVSQYVRGDGSLADFPESIGSGASVSYYLNGSVNQGTIGGVTYYEMNKTPIIGAGTDFTRNSNGYIASFLTDANDPSLLVIPAGNWNFETYFQASSGGGSPTFYLELYKYDGTTFTLIASNSGSPKLINDGTSIEAYFSALAVPQTTLTLTDRLAIRIYVTTAGRTITLHTENGHLCQVITTFTTGLSALNGLTAQVQFFAVGTSGTNFNIASASDTHTFNLPTASATNRGALASADWSTFNNKQNQLNGTGFVKASGTTITYDNSTYQVTSEKGQPNGYASLDSNGKVPLTQINDALIGNVNYQGLWNAATNNPTLANPPSSGTKGYYYIVSTAGTFASISFEVGDWIISNGSAWQKVDNTDAVSSVFGRTGNVTATNGDYNTSQVTENTNLYYTEARVSANTDVAANTAARHNAVTLGTANGLSLSTQVLSLQLATSGQNGALSSTDWNTFNSKENAITAGTTAQYFRGDKTFQTLNTSVVPESGNLYFTNARAIASVLTGYTSGAGTISAADSILSAIQKLNGNIGALVTGVSSVNGQTGVVVLTTTNIAEGTNLYYTEARVNANTNVAANTAARHAAVTLGTANGLSLSTQQLSLGLASAGVTGALSGTDWSTFNSKQQALNGTGFVKISGTTISYDNSTYLTTAAAASTYLALAGGTLTGALGGTTASFSGQIQAATLRANEGIIQLFKAGSFRGGLYTLDAAIGSGTDYSPTLTSETDINFITGGSITKKLIIDSTGAATFSNLAGSGTRMVVADANGLLSTQVITVGTVTNVTASSPLFSSGGATPNITIQQASGSQNGFLSSTDWTTFNNKTSNVGTVTSVAALTLGTSGTDLSSSVANGTTTPVITLNVPTASAANRGALSAADWTTFNNKENAITAGTTAQYYRGDKTFQTLNTAAVPELTNLYYTEARVNANTNVAANTAARHNAVTLGTANGLSLSTQQLSLGLASSSANGALSSTDWTTFNNKQNALTNPVTGTGTAGQVAYWSSGSAITGEANLFWDATNDRLGIGNAVPATRLHITASNDRASIRLQNTAAAKVWELVPSLPGVANSGFSLYNVTDNTTPLHITDNGNLGLGVTPSAWNTVTAFQVGSTSLGGYSNTGYVNSNAFYQTGWKYINSSYAARYEINSSDAGIHIWYTAPSGTAGNAISFTQAMTLGTNSGLSIGTPSAAPAQGLLVQGATTFNSAITGTSANFSNNIVFNRPSTSAGNNIEWKTANTLNWYIGTRGLVDNNFYFVNEGLGVNNLILNASTGAATFSSSVTAVNIIARRDSTTSATDAQFISENRTGSSGQYAIYGSRLDNGSGAGFVPVAFGAIQTSGAGRTGDFIIAVSNTDNVNLSTHERMRITSGGLVGINTNNPGTVGTGYGALTIGGTSGGGINFAANGSTFAQLYGDTSGLAVLAIGSRPIIFITNDTERMRIFSDGNTFIGSSPSNAGFKLDVNGTGRFSGTLRSNDHEIKNSANAETLDVFLSPSTLNAFIDYPSGRSLTIRNKGSLGNLSLASTGAATFSSSVTADGLFRSNQGIYQIFAAGSFRGGLYNYVSASGSGTDYSTTLVSETDLYFTTGGSATKKLTITSAGAATFSSSVTAASFIPSGSTIPTNGMYLPSANTIAFSTNTTERISVSSAGEVQLKQSSNSAQNSVIFNTTNQNAMTLNSSGFLILNGTTGSSRITCYGDGYFSGGIQTGNPYGSTSANWLLGRFLTETTSANGSIRVQIGSKYYNIAAEDLGEVPT